MTFLRQWVRRPQDLLLRKITFQIHRRNGNVPLVSAAVFDALEPFDESNPVERVVDRIQYWLAYLHFGRLGGRGIPGAVEGSATRPAS